MKKNLSLFLVLVSLLVGTYFLQEKRVEKERSQAESKGKLLTVPLTHLKTKYIEAEKKGGSWWAGQVLLSHNFMNLIEKKMSELKEVKEVQGDPKSFFPDPLVFEVNGESWAIGEMTLDKQGFYLSKGKRMVVAFLDGESAELTQDEAEIPRIKRDELKELLSKDLASLKETQLFRFYPRIPLAKITVTAEGHLPFELDLKENHTVPAPIPGIQEHDNLSQKFVSLLTQMNVREELPYSEKLKFKKMGSLAFHSEDGELVWELWLKSKDSADALIIDPKAHRAFLMVGGTLKVFFVQLQDYWDKKVIPPKDFKSFTRLTTHFTQGKKIAGVTVLNREPLQFESDRYKVKTEKMQFLFQFIFNLGPKDQADRVSILSKSERKQILNEEHLRLEMMGQELLLWRKQEELIVVNLTQGFKAHFNLVEESFHGRFEDVLE